MKHAKPARRDWNRVIRMSALVLLAILVAFIVGSTRAEAAPAVDIPLIEVCAKEAPYPALPTQGLPGLVGERPLKVTDDTSPEHIWSTGGFGGLQSHPYDLGCALDPTSWVKITSANSDASLSNASAGLGQTVTSLTDSMDRRAWQPGYVMAFLKSFVDRALDTAEVKILYPLMGAGIILAAIMVLWMRGANGDISGASMSLGWALFVITTTCAILLSPLIVSQWAQQIGNAASGALNGNVNSSDGSTNAIVAAVHYQGWQRRTFGSSTSEAAQKYGPAILASQRFTWTEYDTANRLDGEARGKYVEGLVEKKSKAFKDAAKAVKEGYPAEYRHLTGQQPRLGLAWFEALSAFASSAFRIAVDLLVILCVIMLTMIAVIWVVATPWTVTPKGQQVGMGLINSATTALASVGMAVLYGWGFTIYLSGVMAPGISPWWGLLLLLMGASAFWIALAPFHKMGNIISLGKLNNTGRLMKIIKTAAMAYITGRVAGAVAGKEVAEQQAKPKQSEDAPPVALPQPEVVHATIFNPREAPDMWSHTEHVPDADRVLPEGGPAALPASQPVYQRTDPDATTPPPDDATTAPDEPYEPYQRTDDNEGADSGRA